MPRKAAISINDELLLKRLLREEMLRRLNEVYSGATEPAEKRILKGFKAKFTRTVNEPW